MNINALFYSFWIEVCSDKIRKIPRLGITVGETPLIIAFPINFLIVMLFFGKMFIIECGPRFRVSWISHTTHCNYRRLLKAGVRTFLWIMDPLHFSLALMIHNYCDDSSDRPNKNRASLPLHYRETGFGRCIKKQEYNGIPEERINVPSVPVE